MTTPICSRKNAPRGFTLVMTLVLIALAAALLGRIATRGLSTALESRTRLELTQQKWARESARIALLERAEWLFGDSDALAEEEGLGWPYPDKLQGVFDCGNQTYQFLLADEQAKVSLNTYHRLEPTGMAVLLANAQRNQATGLPLRQHAATPLRPQSGSLAPYVTWGQVIDLPRLANVGKRFGGGKAGSIVEFCLPFSLRQDERLNIRRATDESLRLTAGLLLTPSETEKLVAARAGYSGELRDLLAPLDIPRRRLASLRRLLGDRSSAHSLWIWQEEPDKLVYSSFGIAREGNTGTTLQWP